MKGDPTVRFYPLTQAERAQLTAAVDSAIETTAARLGLTVHAIIGVLKVPGGLAGIGVSYDEAGFEWLEEFERLNGIQMHREEITKQ